MCYRDENCTKINTKGFCEKTLIVRECVCVCTCASRSFPIPSKKAKEWIFQDYNYIRSIRTLQLNILFFVIFIKSTYIRTYTHTRQFIGIKMDWKFQTKKCILSSTFTHIHRYLLYTYTHIHIQEYVNQCKLSFITKDTNAPFIRFDKLLKYFLYACNVM